MVRAVALACVLFALLAFCQGTCNRVLSEYTTLFNHKYITKYINSMLVQINFHLIPQIVMYDGIYDLFFEWKILVIYIQYTTVLFYRLGGLSKTKQIEYLEDSRSISIPSFYDKKPKVTPLPPNSMHNS